MLELLSYFRSSAAFRVRIALYYKGLPFTYQGVHLLEEGGKQFSAEYKALNPQCLVPTLIDDDHVLTQSLAIIEYLEELHPQPPLLPKEASARAKARAFAQAIACDIHPLNNLRVLKYLTHELAISEDQKKGWYLHWLQLGFAALEQRLAEQEHGGRYCFGDTPTIADVCLIPQVYNAIRFHCVLTDYPNLCRVNENCLQLPAFQAAMPENQPDAE